MVSRVLRRFLARRAIPFDVNKIKQELSDIAEEAIDTATSSMSPEGQPIGRMGLLAERVLRLPHVKIPGKPFRLVVETRPGSSNKPTAGGKYSSERRTITLYLNAEWPPEALEAKRWAIVERFQSMGIHEVTHALEVFKKKEVAQYEGADGDPQVYYNQPIEVRAYARQVVDEVLRGFRKMKLRSRRTKEPLPKGRDLIEHLLLAHSNTWREIFPHLNEKNNRLIRQVVVREMQDAGRI